MYIRKNPFVAIPTLTAIESIHIAIARKKKHKIAKIPGCSMKTTAAFRNKKGIRLELL